MRSLAAWLTDVLRGRPCPLGCGRRTHHQAAHAYLDHADGK